MVVISTSLFSVGEAGPVWASALVQRSADEATAIVFNACRRLQLFFISRRFKN
jgi:hypothetical protein